MGYVVPELPSRVGHTLEEKGKIPSKTLEVPQQGASAPLEGLDPTLLGGCTYLRGG